MTQIERLDPEKAPPIESIPARVVKENSDLLLPHLVSTYNSSISESDFPNELKAGDISSLCKKGDVFSKNNFRPITVLSSVSKIFGRLMYEYIMPFVECFLSPLLCGFRKGYNTQHALLNFLETCKIAMDNGGVAGALLMDLSKAFDSLRPRPHVSGYFRKLIFFIRIKKYPRPHEERFRKYTRPHEDTFWIQTPLFDL